MHTSQSKEHMILLSLIIMSYGAIIKTNYSLIPIIKLSTFATKMRERDLREGGGGGEM